jgi:hypothetical protein
MGKWNMVTCLAGSFAITKKYYFTGLHIYLERSLWNEEVKSTKFLGYYFSFPSQ